jgi:hypothetical protein
MSLFDDASLVMIPSAYKDGKLYSIKPTDGSGDFTFSRSTAATRVNADGLIESVTDNVPRLDYTDSSCPALKLEPQRTNLIEYSEAFDNAYWTKTGSSVVSGFASPSADSPLGAFKLVEDSSSGIHRVKADGISVSANRYNVSVFVKPNGRNEIRVSLANYFCSGTDAYFNLDTKVIIYGTRAENGLIETFANGWFRCSFSSTSGELAGPNAFVHIDTALSNSNSYQGDGTSGVYIYGAQLEQRSYATSYIPTYGTSVTFASDTAINQANSNLPTGYPFSLFAEVDVVDTSSGHAITLLDSSNSTSYYTIDYYSNVWRITARPNTEIARISSTSAPTLGTHKLLGIYTDSTMKLYLDGALIASGNNTETWNTNIDDLLLGQLRTVADTETRNPVREALIFNQELTNEEAIALTQV